MSLYTQARDWYKLSRHSGIGVAFVVTGSFVPPCRWPLTMGKVSFQPPQPPSPQPGHADRSRVAPRASRVPCTGCPQGAPSKAGVSPLSLFTPCGQSPLPLAPRASGFSAASRLFHSLLDLLQPPAPAAPRPVFSKAPPARSPQRRSLRAGPPRLAPPVSRPGGPRGSCRWGPGLLGPEGAVRGQRGGGQGEVTQPPACCHVLLSSCRVLEP